MCRLKLGLVFAALSFVGCAPVQTEVAAPPVSSNPARLDCADVMPIVARGEGWTELEGDARGETSGRASRRLHAVSDRAERMLESLGAPRDPYAARYRDVLAYLRSGAHVAALRRESRATALAARTDAPRDG